MLIFLLAALLFIGSIWALWRAAMSPLKGQLDQVAAWHRQSGFANLTHFVTPSAFCDISSGHGA